MAASGVSTIPTRERIDGEVVPLDLLAVHQALVAVSDDWDLDSGVNAIDASTKAFVISKMPIPTDIDPEGVYRVRTVLRATLPPPAAATTIPVDVPEPVALLILQGDMRIHHERSLEEPPVHFLEGEDFDEAQSDEDERGGSSSGPPRKRARIVTAGNVATLGLVDKGLKFGSVLEPHVPAGTAKK